MPPCMSAELGCCSSERKLGNDAAALSAKINLGTRALYLINSRRPTGGIPAQVLWQSWTSSGGCNAEERKSYSFAYGRYIRSPSGDRSHVAECGHTSLALQSF